MKNIPVIIGFIMALIAINACKKSADFIADNSTPTGKGFRPVSTNPLWDMAPPVSALNNKSYSVGQTFTTEIQYWSESPVKEISLYNTIGSGTKTLVKSYPHKAAFSSIKRMDTLLVSYTMPAAAVGTRIALDYQIWNENGLGLAIPKTATVIVK